MATARELLAQVDALMRRNREEAANAEIPVLTDAIAADDRPPAPEPDGVPVLTDVVQDLDVPTIPAPDYIDEPFDSPEASMELGVASAAVPLSDSAADAARWEMLAEDIRMQVLQRIDIFTDTGLQEQLKARLQPIVDDASADLVATINQHVGQLLRAYVAEAIEREIDKWRRGGN
jgi:hypothetical protein